MLSFGSHGRKEHHGMKIDYLTIKKMTKRGVRVVYRRSRKDETGRALK